MLTTILEAREHLLIPPRPPLVGQRRTATDTTTVGPEGLACAPGGLCRLAAARETALFCDICFGHGLRTPIQADGDRRAGCAKPTVCGHLRSRNSLSIVRCRCRTDCRSRPGGSSSVEMDTKPGPHLVGLHRERLFACSAAQAGEEGPRPCVGRTYLRLQIGCGSDEADATALTIVSLAAFESDDCFIPKRTS